MSWSSAADASLGPAAVAGRWSVAPAALVAAGAALLLVASSFVRLRRAADGDRPGLGRLALYGAGVALVTLSLVSPLDAIGEDYLLSAHMLQHLILGDVTPLLVVLALRGSLARHLFRAVPSPLRRVLAGLLSRPSITGGAWLLVVGLWHVPALFDDALAHPAAHELEHLSFLVTGLVVWTQIVDPAGLGLLGPGRRAALALALLAGGTVLSEALIFCGPLYRPYVEQPDRLLGLSPAADQARAGLLMMIEQLATFGTAAFLLLATRLGRPSGARRPSGAGVAAGRGC